MHTPLPAEHLTDTPRRVIRALFEWRWSAIGFFLCFFTFLMVIAYAWPPSYTANATVLVKAGRHNAPEGTATTSEFMRLQSSPEDVISEINVMLSRPVLDAVATDLEAWRPGGETKRASGPSWKVSKIGAVVSASSQSWTPTNDSSPSCPKN